MQVDAARTTELLGRPVPPADTDSGEARSNRRRKTA
jgi:hypothetical protein